MDCKRILEEIHQYAQCNPELLLQLFKLAKPVMKAKMLEHKNKNGWTVAMILAQCNADHLLKIFKLAQPDMQAKMLEHKNKHKYNVHMYLAQYNSKFVIPLHTLQQSCASNSNKRKRSESVSVSEPDKKHQAVETLMALKSRS